MQIHIHSSFIRTVVIDKSKPYRVRLFNDLTVGFGVSPNQPKRLAGFTAGGESHPALKIMLISYYQILCLSIGI